jgi:DNA invertase Pin-like site-specific DNA recombinase
MMVAAIYARCSTRKQELDAQINTLKDVAKRAGWEIGHIFTDFAISGAKGREDRQGLDELLIACSRREIDRVLVFDVSRLGRSLTSLVSTLDELKSSGVGFYCYAQNIDTSTASGQALFGMISVFAEFERSMISARVKNGLEQARKRGSRLGRPGVAKIDAKKVVELRKQGLTQQKIAARVGISQAKVSQLLAGAM